MKNTFGQYLKEAVDTGYGHRVTNAYMMIGDSGTLEIHFRDRSFSNIELDVDMSELRRAFDEDEVKVGVYYRGRNFMASLDLDDDGLLMLNGIVPGRRIGFDVTLPEMKKIFNGKGMSVTTYI